MGEDCNQWWYLRSADLLALGKAQTPLYVYNEETLNEIFFDLSATEVVEGLFYPFEANFHPKILRKAFEQQVYFRCNSLADIASLREVLPGLSANRISLLTDQGSVKDCEQALGDGIHVAVRTEKDALKSCLKGVHKESVFLCMDMGDEILAAGPTNLTAKGIYICPESRFFSLCSRMEKISLFDTISRHFPNLSNLVLGNKTVETPPSAMTNRDIPAIQAELEAIQNACPKFSLYMEVPTHLLCYAGILMVKAIESGSAEGMPYVRMELAATDALLGELHGRPQQLFNLSKPEQKAVFLNQTARKYGSDVMLYPKKPVPVDAGDILLITHMGAYRQTAQVRGAVRNGIQEWYLNARCFCPVALHKRGPS